jgi:hypothetical protein
MASRRRRMGGSFSYQQPSTKRGEAHRKPAPADGPRGPCHSTWPEGSNRRPIHALPEHVTAWVPSGVPHNTGSGSRSRQVFLCADHTP